MSKNGSTRSSDWTIDNPAIFKFTYALGWNSMSFNDARKQIDRGAYVDYPFHLSLAIPSINDKMAEAHVNLRFDKNTWNASEHLQNYDTPMV